MPQFSVQLSVDVGRGPRTFTVDDITAASITDAIALAKQSVSVVVIGVQQVPSPQQVPLQA